MHDEYVFETVPVFLLLADESLQIVFSSRVADSVIGPAECCSLRDVLDPISLVSIEELQCTLWPGEAPVHLMVSFLGRNGLPKKVAGLVDVVARPDGPPLLRFTAAYDVRCAHWLEDLLLSEEVLRGFVQTSSEAMWCIEFSEPVDISLGEMEIVRQVFENECHWLLCNEPMASLYGLPEGLDLNLQPVSLYFPRNPENEAFVRKIIESGFSVDNVPSIDVRHDGSVLYMENDVRSTIVNGHLIRLWGKLRDVTESRLLQNRLAREAEAVRNILSAIPDAILVINRNRSLVAVNQSFETLLGWNSEAFLGRDIQSIIDLECSLPGGRRWYGFDRHRWLTLVKTKSGSHLRCEALISPIGDEGLDHFVLSLRPLSGPNESYCQEVSS